MINNTYYPKDFQKDIKILSDKICEEYSKVDVIYGIARGGLFAATALSYKLNVPLKVFDPKGSDDPYKEIVWDVSRTRVLVVDDLIDSGYVMRNIIEKCERWTYKRWDYGGDLRTAVLIYNINQDIVPVPDFFARTIDRNKNKEYIRFFWEDTNLIYQ